MKKRFPLKIVNSLACCLLALNLTSCACSDNRKPTAQKDNQKENPDDVAMIDSLTLTPVIIQAAAEVHPIGEHQITGKVTFTKVADGIEIVADIQGLKPGKHGFHAMNMEIAAEKMEWQPEGILTRRTPSMADLIAQSGMWAISVI